MMNSAKGNTMNASRIAKIIAVVDTREYMEDGDRWVPIPGSGIEHECTRCGRLHEVHAEVELEDGSRTVVGTGCMGAESMDVVAALKSGASKAKAAKVSAMRAEKVDRLAWQIVARVLAVQEELPALGGCIHRRITTMMRDAMWYARDSKKLETLEKITAYLHARLEKEAPALAK